MEDIIALVIVVGIFALFAWGVTTLIKRVKREKEQLAKRQAAADKYWEEQRSKKVYVPSQWEPVAPSKPAKPKKTETVGQTYANMNTKQTSTTSTTSSSDDGFVNGMLTGMLIDSIVHSHKSEPSIGVSSSTKDDTSSWGLDDSDSRKSISDSMDTSSSWSSSDFGSSDSGPSSDW